MKRTKAYERAVDACRSYLKSDKNDPYLPKPRFALTSHGPVYFMYGFEIPVGSVESDDGYVDKLISQNPLP